MADKKSKTKNSCFAEEWLEEDNLMLLECWSRDGYTYQDIANRIGISGSTLTAWRKTYPEIHEALRKGREIIDYKVENALLKSALGYKTKEVKVTTTIKFGKVVETIKEVTDKEQAPNVSAIQCWLYNRLPQKWKNMNSKSNILEDMDEDTSIQVTVTRASQKAKQDISDNKENDIDTEWEEEVNQSIEIRNATEEEKAEKEKQEAKQREKSAKTMQTKVEQDEEDLDYWPDDWEDDTEG